MKSHALVFAPIIIVKKELNIFARNVFKSVETYITKEKHELITLTEM